VQFVVLSSIIFRRVLHRFFGRGSDHRSPTQDFTR
jgi:hypothetical protein